MIVGCLIYWLSWCGWLFVYYAIYALWRDIASLLWWFDDDYDADLTYVDLMIMNEITWRCKWCINDEKHDDEIYYIMV